MKGWACTGMKRALGHVLEAQGQQPGKTAARLPMEQRLEAGEKPAVHLQPSTQWGTKRVLSYKEGRASASKQIASTGLACGPGVEQSRSASIVRALPQHLRLCSLGCARSRCACQPPTQAQVNCIKVRLILLAWGRWA